MRELDIVIAGGGTGGLAAAAIIGSTGHHILCCDPNPAATAGTGRRPETRTTALFLPAVDALRNAGIWEHIEQYAEPLRVMRIIDVGDRPPQTCKMRDFDSASISESCFGWSIPNSVLVSHLAQKVDDMPNVEFLAGRGVSSVLARTDEVRISLSDGARVRARLLIAADGRDSTVRTEVGVPCQTFRFGQKALTFNLTHTAPHCGISTEIYQSGGPFTSVPLPCENGMHFSAVVWMEKASEVAALLRLPAREFESRVKNRSLGMMGDVRLASDRREWPVVAQIARRFFAERTAIVAEAAHVLPPIGAQGLNMTIADIVALHKVIRQAPVDLGGRHGLIQYHRTRRLEAVKRLVGIGILNVMSMTEVPVLVGLRKFGLSAACDIEPLRNTLMTEGLGPRIV